MIRLLGNSSKSHRHNNSIIYLLGLVYTANAQKLTFVCLLIVNYDEDVASVVLLAYAWTRLI